MLSVSVRKSGTCAMLFLRGSLVIGRTTALVNAVSSLGDVGTIVVDLARVTKIDAAGLGELLRIREKAQLSGTALKLMNVMNRVYDVLEITKLNSVFEIASEPEVRFVDCILAPTPAIGTSACL